MRTTQYWLAFTLLFQLLVLTCQSATAADSSAGSATYFSERHAWLDARLRYEHAADDALTNADALTLRGALGLDSGPIVSGSGWSGLLEVEHTSVLSRKDYTSGAQDRGTVLIADPASTELNQAYIAYESPRGLVAKIGRQTLSFGDERFVGSVAFRQNHQSFDAASVRYSGVEDWVLNYAYVNNVNRIFGDRADDRPAGVLGDHKQDSHLVNVVYDGVGFGSLEAYAYLIDNKDFQRASTDTYGVRFTGSKRPKQLSYLYTLEYARQRSGSLNPRDYQTDYWRLMAGLAYKRVSLQLSQERLGSDNNAGFVTPLATLHRYQGWADKFAALTPNEGVVATTLTLAGRWPGFRYRIQYHDFNRNEGSADIGREFGFHLQYRYKLKYFAELKYADYRGHNAVSGVAGLESDTRRLFLTLSATHGKRD